ncbi:HAD hydrolase-like protein, partial [Salmonella enterica subsp. enterica serovar Mbandaka]|nr:HAD hydrolase-like protein [Salmonella enterica subsp. enterica serovar Mbandaka]
MKRLPAGNFFNACAQRAAGRIKAATVGIRVGGDNLRTDILAGFQAGLETILVLSGVSTINDIDSMPFRPSWIY